MNVRRTSGGGRLHAATTIGSARSAGRRLRVAGAAAALALLAAACSDGDTASAGGEATVEITSPAAGTQVGRSFDVVFDASVPIGEPDTGREHIHLHFDGDPEYEIVYDETHSVTGLDPGEHSLVAVIANADHSETDARSREVVVEVTDDDTGSDETGDTAPATSDRDVGY